MKKLILILFFCTLTATSFAQASAASARMFKSFRAWQQREFYRTVQGYTLDTAELYALIRLSKDLQGHVNWEYATSNLFGTFSSIFPILGRINSAPMQQSYFNFQTNTLYSGHRIDLFGSPTLSNNSIVFNGTTQYGVLQCFRNWAGIFTNMTPRFLMDSILNISPTDTVAQTRMNLAIYMKDATDRLRFGAIGTGTPTTNFRILKVNDSMYRSVMYTDDANGLLSYTQSNLSTEGLFTTARNGLENKLFIRGAEVASSTNASYNFGLARNITNNFEVMSLNAAGLVAGSVQFLAIMNRAYDATEQAAFNNALKEFVRRKTQ